MHEIFVCMYTRTQAACNDENRKFTFESIFARVHENFEPRKFGAIRVNLGRRYHGMFVADNIIM